MTLIEILSMNLRYYRKVYHVSQEQFAEIIGTSLSYLNRIERRKPDIKFSTVEKFAKNLNKYDSNLKITASDLLTYNEKHKTDFARIDEIHK